MLLIDAIEIAIFAFFNGSRLMPFTADFSPLRRMRKRKRGRVDIVDASLLVFCRRTYMRRWAIQLAARILSCRISCALALPRYIRDYHLPYRASHSFLGFILRLVMK